VGRAGRERRLVRMGDRLAFGGAERYDLLLHPEEPGEYLVHVDWFHWVPLTGTQPLATRTVPLVCR